MIDGIMVIYRDTDRVTIGITEVRFKRALRLNPRITKCSIEYEISHMDKRCICCF